VKVKVHVQEKSITKPRQSDPSFGDDFEQRSSSAPQSVALPGDEIPIDSDHTSVLKSFQRFRKDEIACAFTLFEANNSKFSAALASLNCHDAIISNLRLQMPILFRLLPKGIRFRSARPLHYLRKSRRLHFHHFHKKSPPENYGKEGQTTVAAFLPWRGS
jgi:hypothetical protein